MERIEEIRDRYFGPEAPEEVHDSIVTCDLRDLLAEVDRLKADGREAAFQLKRIDKFISTNPEFSGQVTHSDSDRSIAGTVERLVLVLIGDRDQTRNRADALREAASSALCLLVEGPEVVGTVQAVDDARQVLSEALQAAKHPQGTYRLTPIQRTLLERRGWQGQDPVAWLLKQIEHGDLGGEG